MIDWTGAVTNRYCPRKIWRFYSRNDIWKYLKTVVRTRHLSECTVFDPMPNENTRNIACIPPHTGRPAESMHRSVLSWPLSVGRLTSSWREIFPLGIRRHPPSAHARSQAPSQPQISSSSGDDGGAPPALSPSLPPSLASAMLTAASRAVLLT